MSIFSSIYWQGMESRREESYSGFQKGEERAD